MQSSAFVPHSNKAVVGRYIEMWNSGNTALADEILAANYVDLAHPEVTGPTSVKESLIKFRAAFPDFHITVEFMIGEVDWVVVPARLSRTVQGKETVSRVCWLFRIASGKLVELQTWYDRSG